MFDTFNVLFTLPFCILKVLQLRGVFFTVSNKPINLKLLKQLKFGIFLIQHGFTVYLCCQVCYDMASFKGIYILS